MCITSCQRRTCDNSLTHTSEALRESLNRRSAIPNCILQQFFMQNKKALLLLFSKFQRAIDSCPKGLYPKVSRIAGEDLAAVTPPERVPKRESLNTPELKARIPARAHSPDTSIIAFNIGNVGVSSVDKQQAVFSLALLLEQGKKMSKLNLCSVAEFSQDGNIRGSPFQPMDNDNSIAYTFLNFVKEMRFEVLSCPADVGGFERFVVADKTLDAGGCGSSDSPE